MTDLRTELRVAMLGVLARSIEDPTDLALATMAADRHAVDLAADLDNDATTEGGKS